MRTQRPRCDTCRRLLDWDLRPLKARYRGRRIYHVRRPAKAWSQLAIRCADCFHVFCRRCARKHFVPVFRVQEKVLKRLDKVVAAALKGVTCGAPGKA